MTFFFYFRCYVVLSYHEAVPSVDVANVAVIPFTPFEHPETTWDCARAVLTGTRDKQNTSFLCCAESPWDVFPGECYVILVSIQIIFYGTGMRR